MSVTDRSTDEPAHPEEAGARVFHVLGRLYLDPPDASTLAEVSTWADRWLEAGPPAHVGGTLASLSTVEPEDADQLNEAFTRLFRGVVPDAPDPPYESVYRDGALDGPSAGAVRSAYRAAGVDIAPDSSELADHLGMELHFVGTLREQGDLRAAESFIEDHPRRWFDGFANAVRAHDPPAFYDGVLELTAIVLDATQEDE